MYNVRNQFMKSIHIIYFIIIYISGNIEAHGPKDCEIKSTLGFFSYGFELLQDDLDDQLNSVQIQNSHLTWLIIESSD